MQTLTDAQAEGMTVDLNAVTEASINQEGQIILTSEDGHGKKNILYNIFLLITF